MAYSVSVWNGMQEEELDCCSYRCQSGSCLIHLLRRNMIGPEVVHLGPHEVADSLGCSWLGVARLESALHPSFRFTQVVRVFGTGLVGPSTTMHTIDTVEVACKV